MCLLLTAICGCAIWYLDQPLRNDVTPFGILELEFCGVAGNCGAVLAGWTGQSRDALLVLLGLDYLFLCLYPASLALLIEQQQRRMGGRSTFWPATLGVAIALADALENVGSLRMLLNGVTPLAAISSSIFASIKFALLLAGLGWLGFLFWQGAFRQRVRQ